MGKRVAVDVCEACRDREGAVPPRKRSCGVFVLSPVDVCWLRNPAHARLIASHAVPRLRTVTATVTCIKLPLLGLPPRLLCGHGCVVLAPVTVVRTEPQVFQVTRMRIARPIIWRADYACQPATFETAVGWVSHN